MVERCKLAEPLQSAESLALHKSLLWRRLLGVAHSTRLRLTLGRHRVRCEDASTRDDEHVRESIELVAHAGAATGAGDRTRAGSAAGFCVLPQIFLWLQTGVRRCRSMGADG